MSKEIIKQEILKSKFLDLLAKIPAKDYVGTRRSAKYYADWLKFTRTDIGHPHIEIDFNGKYHYVVTERGNVLKCRTTRDIDELMYWIFSSITFDIAVGFELKNRLPDKDSRRLMFDEQLRLMGLLSLEWRNRLAKEIQSILSKHPYDDEARARIHKLYH